MSVAAPAGRILGVLEVTRLIKAVLEPQFPALWVRGEITNLRKADSGHYYFSLKEGREAILPAAMFRTSAQRLGFELREGGQVEAFGAIELYEPRGSYQLVVREMRPAGLGALLLALEELKRRLQAEGLFDDQRKKPLPRYPRRIGVVTSPTGAAVRDIIKVLRARWPSIGIVLAPVRVQGEGAAGEIAQAIARFNRHGVVDLLIVGRGGGSLEDLWAFNEEIVVRAIAASRIPIISAVGHEVDRTLADFAADVRAATPSNAAELAVPARAEIVRHVAALDLRAARAVRHSVAAGRQRLSRLIEHYGFRRVRDFFGLFQQRVDDAGHRARLAMRRRLDAARLRLDAARGRYALRGLPRVIDLLRDRVRRRAGSLAALSATFLRARRQRVTAHVDRLRALSPKLVLERGYCLARRGDGTLLRTAASLEVGEMLTVEFARGEADARVETIREGE
jgi:exodeoxyribonuclease VII large subunit